MTRILLVEDNPDVLVLLARLLLEAGNVATAQTVEQARDAEKPDVIVSDWFLADRTARDVAAAWPGVPVIVVSGANRPADYAGPWLMKPILRTDLLAAVRAALGQP